MAPLPLEGIRVIDLTVVWAGPLACELLGDLGAEVFRVESLQHFDTNTRGNAVITKAQVAAGRGGTFVDGDPGDRPWERAASFNTTGRNKKSVTLDLSRPEGREVFLRLVKQSDIFVESNSAGVVQKLGIGYDVLSQVNPGLIMICLPAFGGTGPYRDFRGYGGNLEATTGHLSLRGYPDTDVTSSSGALMSDATSGVSAVFAVLSALFHRMQTGRGQFIDMSQAENVVHCFSQAVMDYSMNGRVQGTLGNRDASRAPQGVYRSAGADAWIAISCGDDAEFQALCAVMNRPGLAADPRFADGLSRYHHQDELDPEITAWTSTVGHYDAFHALQAAGVTAGPVLTIPEVFHDPHLRARDIWQQVTHPTAGTHWYMRSIVGRMSKTPLHIRDAAPTLGQHNEYVYKQVLGYSDEEYRWFEQHEHAGDTYVALKRPKSGTAPHGDGKDGFVVPATVQPGEPGARRS